MRLGDGQIFMEIFLILIPLMEFISAFFHCVRGKSPRFLQKLSFDKKLAKKPKSFDFETIYRFCSYLLVEIISIYKIVKLHWICPLE